MSEANRPGPARDRSTPKAQPGPTSLPAFHSTETGCLLEIVPAQRNSVRPARHSQA